MNKYLPPSPPITPPELQETESRSQIRTQPLERISSTETSIRGGFLPPTPPAAPAHPVPVLPPEAELYRKLVSCGSLSEYIQLVASSYTAREAAESLKSQERKFLGGCSPLGASGGDTDRLLTEFTARKSAFHTPLSVKTTTDYWTLRNTLTQEKSSNQCYLYPYGYLFPASDKSFNSSSTMEEKIKCHLATGSLVHDVRNTVNGRNIGSAVDLRIGNQQEQEQEQEQKPTGGFFRPWESGKWWKIYIFKVFTWQNKEMIGGLEDILVYSRILFFCSSRNLFDLLFRSSYFALCHLTFSTEKFILFKVSEITCQIHWPKPFFYFAADISGDPHKEIHTVSSYKSPVRSWLHRYYEAR